MLFDDEVVAFLLLLDCEGVLLELVVAAAAAVGDATDDVLA